MPKKIPVHTIVVQRDGKTVIPAVGKPFDFTDAEIADVRAVDPKAFRDLVNEEVDTPAPKAKAKGPKADADL